jgi:hypothetical protein
MDCGGKTHEPGCYSSIGLHQGRNQWSLSTAPSVICAVADMSMMQQHWSHQHLMKKLQSFSKILHTNSMLIWLTGQRRLNSRRLRHYATSWKVAGSRPDEVISFSIYLILPVALGPGIHLASNRNKYQNRKIMFLGSKVWRADDLVAACELTVYTMWDS